MMKWICCNRIAAFLMALGLVLVSVLPGFVVPVSAEEEPELVEYVFGSDDVPLVYTYPNGYYYSFHKGHCYNFGPLGWPYMSYVGEEPLTVSFDPSKGYTVWLLWINSKLYSSADMSNEVWNVSSLVDSGFRRMRLFYQSKNSSGHFLNPECDITIRCFDSAFDTVGFLYSEDLYGLLDTSNYSSDQELVADVVLPVGTVYIEFYFAFSFLPDSSGQYTENHNITIDGTQGLGFQFLQTDVTPPDNVDGSDTPDPTEPSVDPGGSGNTGGSGSSGSGSTGGSSSFDDSGIINSVGSAADKIINEIGGAISDQTHDITGVIGNQTGQIGAMFDDVQENLEDINKTQQDLLAESEKTNEKLDSTNQNLETMIGDGTEGDELQSGSDSITSDTDSVSDFEKEQQSVLDDNFESIQNEINFSSYINALAFVQQILNLAFLNMGDVRIIYSFPLFLGMFFFLCSRAPGAVRPTKVSHKDRAVPRKTG